MSYSKLRLDEIERLSLLIEECGEVIQAATKVLRHGYDSYNPDKSEDMSKDPGFRYTNRMQLMKEIGHLFNAIDMMAKAHDIHALMCEEEREKKAQTIRQWLHHQ